MKAHFDRRNAGFTLLELSIVLVVAGLIIGGVLVGKQLIEAAKIRADMTTVERLQASIGAFKLKYGELPGDMMSASSHFGTCNGVTTYVVNGNGDGVITALNGHQAMSDEPTSLMIELACAGLVSISQIEMNGFSNVPGMGFPASKISGGIVAIGSTATGLNYILMGKQSGYVLIDPDTGYASNSSMITSRAFYPSASATAAYTPQQAIAIDSKMDDGIPSAGVIRPMQVGVGIDIETDLATNDAEGCQNSDLYNTGVNTPLCALRVKASF